MPDPVHAAVSRPPQTVGKTKVALSPPILTRHGAHDRLDLLSKIILHPNVPKAALDENSDRSALAFGGSSFRSPMLGLRIVITPAIEALAKSVFLISEFFGRCGKVTVKRMVHFLAARVGYRHRPI
jgi:hypothetical protein